MSDDRGPDKRPKGDSGFFSVDLGAFRCAATCGLNAAIAHLILARGTGRDNRISQWSVNAIEQRTGISRPNANKALSLLLDRGIWRKTRGGKHPIYEAVPGDQIPNGAFTPEQQLVLGQIRSGDPLLDIATADMLVARRLAIELQQVNSQRSFELDESAIAELVERKAVWLPNALIDGAADEVAPVELIRETRNLFALQMIIELYAIQFLPHFGGAPHEMIKVQFERKAIREQGPFTVWGFRPKGTLVDWDIAKHFMCGFKTERPDGKLRDAGWNKMQRALGVLTELGLVEKVGMLMDGRDADAEIIHPYGVQGGEAPERDLTAVARKAAKTMLPESHQNWAEGEGYSNYMVPVRKHITGVTMIEIFRLKYRPHTKATAAWYAKMLQTAADWICRYRIIAEAGEPVRRAASS